MNLITPQAAARLPSSEGIVPTLPHVPLDPLCASGDALFVAPIHLQPPSFQQSPKAIASQRAAWATPPSPDAPNYLLIKGQRVAVPFPTVCYDQQRHIAIDAPLPMRAWTNNILDTVWSGVRTLTSFSALRATKFRQMLEPARVKSLWTQGNLQVCAVPRQDPSGAEVDTVVLHWDGCNSSAQMFEVLRSLGLSAHLLVDSDATVYQLMDLAEMKAYHAGWINERSIGIEFNNPIDPSRMGEGRPNRGLARELVPHHDGLVSSHLDFTLAQKQRCLEILDVLHEHFNVPRTLPAAIDMDGIESSPGLMPTDFSGICGHYHVGAHKVDPGLSFWPVVRRHWANLQSMAR